MRKILKRLIICAAIPGILWSITLLRDRQQLRNELIRFHVVADSNTEHDQTIKLQVRDAVLQSLQSDLGAIADVDAAKAYLRENLPKIRTIANETLEAAGFQGEAVVSLCKEAFDTRQYDTFTLPAGIYESLRIVIGEGEGRNWWCVAFPTLCLPATAEGFADTATGAGFSETLSETLSGSGTYTLRFYLLDALGNLENILFAE